MTAVDGRRLQSKGKDLSQIFAGLVILAVWAGWGVLMLDAVIMPLMVGHTVTVSVPDLRGINWQTGDSLSCSLGLQLVRGRDRIDRKSPPGTVVDQFPSAGSVTKPGRRVEVILAADMGAIVCPSVIGRSPRDAELVADSAGIRIDAAAVQYRFTDNAPPGVVTGQIPKAGEMIRPGEAMHIVVSLGAEPSQLTAPNLIGLRIEDVGYLLARAKMQLGRISRFPDASSPPGTIIWQSHPAGTAVEPGLILDVQVAVNPIVDTVRATRND